MVHQLRSSVLDCSLTALIRNNEIIHIKIDWINSTILFKFSLSNNLLNSDTTNIVEWACDVLLTMKFDIEVKKKKKGASRDKKRSGKLAKAMLKSQEAQKNQESKVGHPKHCEEVVLVENCFLIVVTFSFFLLLSNCLIIKQINVIFVLFWGRGFVLWMKSLLPCFIAWISRTLCEKRSFYAAQNIKNFSNLSSLGIITSFLILISSLFRDKRRNLRKWSLARN